MYLRLRRRLRIDVTGYLRRHPLSCDFLRDTPTRILVSVGASESTSLDISARHPLSCDFLRDTPTRILVSVGASESTSLDISARHPLSYDFLRDTPTCIFVSAGASESTSLDISAAIPSVATSCEIRRLVSSSPPAPPNRRHWISPPPSPQLRLLARYADSYLSVRRRLRIDVIRPRQRYLANRQEGHVWVLLHSSLLVPSQVHISHVLDPIHQRQIECRTTEMSQLPLTLKAGMRYLACSLRTDQMRMAILPPLLHSLQLKLPLLHFFPDRRYPSLTYIENV